MAIELSNAVFRDTIVRLGYPEPAPGVLHIVGLRLCQPWADSPPGKPCIQIVKSHFNYYTSTIALFGTSFGLWLGSVDPGDDYTYDPMNPDGCFHLADGCWLYQKGSHSGHPALVQAAPVTGYRDGNKSGTIEGAEASEPYSGYLGIDIHAGGTGATIDAWSAGCQIIKGGWDGDPWQAFYTAIEAAGQATHNYYLFSGSALEH